MENKKLAVFCGSKSGREPEYQSECLALAKIMRNRNIDLIYGGGNVGLMGILADELMTLGGRVYGVIPEKLMNMEVGHTDITELYVVKTMHERKAMMADLSDGFLALPGGIGTLEEIIEVFTWQQIGYHVKPCALLNIKNYYDPLLAFIDQMVNHDFLSRQTQNKLIVEQTPEKIINRIFP